MTRTQRTGLLAKALLAIGAAALALAVVEIALRLAGRPGANGPLGALHFEDAARARVDLTEAARRGVVVPLPAELTPRPRWQFAPGASFFLCYADTERLRRDWLDDRGCVAVAINRYGLRERDEVGPEKPAGQKRIVCIGDSFTFGWGIPVERNWVRLLEAELRRGGSDVRTVNCGAAGAICADEYEWGLRHRFGAFQPDAVIATLCLNDLLASSGLCFLPQPAAAQGDAGANGSTGSSSGLLLLDRLRQALAGDPLALDPDRDWVGELLALPRKEGEEGGLYGPDKPFDAMWPQGTPQRALAAMRDWCRERNVPFLVVLWPFLQGLGEGRRYPFAKMHALVAAFCQAEGIPFLDLLPVLAPHRAEDLWVTPADMHPNPHAQQLVLPAITAFAREHARW